MKLNQKILHEIETELTNELKIREAAILEKIRVRLGYESYSFSRFNGLFGGKNNIYVNSVMTQFTDFNDFYSKWLEGVINDYKCKLKKTGSNNTHNAILMKDPEIEEFVRIFLKRNFYRNLKPRTRSKPEQQLWDVWFGFNVVFGLLISPVFTGDRWKIDKSEIRRKKYDYWTIGHVFQEGLIDNSLGRPYPIESLDQFESVYLSIFRQLSNSIYEKQILEKYIEYLKSSNDLDSEPLLIPEIRYAGLEKKHEHRLDFTVLNSHTRQYIGFEISPSSSHLSIKGLKGKNQKEVNAEFSEKWHKEMEKRNKYFQLFGITTITFTEKMLEQIDDCWKIIEQYLRSRSKEKTSIQEQLQIIRNI